ncbi:hypothetical protein FHQ08_06020 [Lactobacillus sp. CC-MHH1034]|uniref:DUF5067 domain-containing protein n=1 Tax=Agrilactobacillus fermenti TaxID=2586909 RepID=UPI001E3E28BB|nr:DUF5067 domain-containing protein [Agrilactobacillus fermenti]MCD2256273.1 hypothetical protein [Agrilactobacillus fermenti]
MKRQQRSNNRSRQTKAKKTAPIAATSRGDRRQIKPKRPKKRFFKHVWVWCLLGLLLFGVLFSLMTTLKTSSQETTATNTPQTTLQLDRTQFLTNKHGVATVTGKGAAAATIYVDNQKQTTVNKHGKFHFKYKLDTPQTQTIQVTARSFVGTTQSKQAAVVPSRAYLEYFNKSASRSSNRVDSSSSNSATMPNTGSDSAAQSSNSAPAPDDQQAASQDKSADNGHSPLAATKTINFEFDSTTITTVETQVDNGQVKVILNWVNKANQQAPTFNSLISSVAVSQNGQSLDNVQNDDTNTNQLPQFQNTVGATIPITLLFKLTNSNDPLTITITPKDVPAQTVQIP